MNDMTDSEALYLFIKKNKCQPTEAERIKAIDTVIQFMDIKRGNSNAEKS